MGHAMPDLESLARFWKAGAVLLAGVALALAGTGLLVGLVLTVALSVFGINDDSALWLTLYSVPIWGPIALAYLLQTFPRWLLSESWS